MHTRAHTAASIAAVLLLTLASVGSRALLAQAPPKPVLRASLSPAGVTAGSTQSLTFVLTSLDQAKGTLSLRIPTAASGVPWTAPQISNASAPGWVAVQKGTCQSALARLSTVDARTILVDFKCAPKKAFTVVYGGGAAKAIAATRVGVTTFATASDAGRGFVPLTVQPAVSINPGPAAALRLAGLGAAIAGTSQSLMLTAVDAFENLATGYRGTVAFSSTDPTVVLAGHTFVAADAGAHGFNATLTRAGSQSITATDSAGTPTAAQAGPVTISPGPAATIEVGVQNAANFAAWSGTPPVFMGCGAAVEDAYGNSRSDSVVWSSTDPHATLGSSLAGAVAGCNFKTVGDQTVTVTHAVDTSLSAQITVHVTGGPVAHPDDVTVLDPTHAYGTTRWPIHAMRNDIQQPRGQVYNPLLGLDNTFYSVTQPSYTDPTTGTLYQVGVLGFSSDLHFLIWDLDPPGDVQPIVPNAALKRCPASATADAVCRIDAPMDVEYTLTDSVNRSTTTLTLHLETPDTPPTPPAVTTATSSLTLNSNASTTATLAAPQIQVPVAQSISLVTAPSPPPVPGNPAIPAGAVSIGLSFNATVSTGCTGVNCAVTPANVIGPSGTGTLVASTTDVASGAYAFPGPPLTTARIIGAADFLLEAPLHDIWAGNQTTTTSQYPWLLAVGAPTATGMATVQLFNGGHSDPTFPYKEWSILTIVWNFGASFCSGNQIGVCGIVGW